MSLLEHGDHRKAGRALIIVSSMTLLLSQCTPYFDQITLLGFDTHLNHAELSGLLHTLVFVYLALFLWRIFRSDILFLFHDINDNVLERRARTNRIAAEWLKEAKSKDNWFYRRFSGVTKSSEVESSDFPKLTVRKRSFGELQMGLEAKIVRFYHVRGWLEYGLLLLIEVFFPITFALGALYFNLGSRICPSHFYSQERGGYINEFNFWVQKITETLSHLGP